MGARLVALARASGKFQIEAAIERGDHPMLSHDVGVVAGMGPVDIQLTSDMRTLPQVLIDFTVPASARHWLKVCRDRGIAMLIGTTGLKPADHDAIDQAARDIPILQAANTSLGVTVLCRVAAQVAKLLGDDYDVEIVESHHRFKKDAPSGTALALADAMLAATGKTRESLVNGRQGDESVRKRGEIGMHSLRIGDEIGTHIVSFASLGERIELSHVATNRDTFVHGALRAAEWLATRPAGRYTISNVLGLE